MVQVLENHTRSYSFHQQPPSFQKGIWKNLLLTQVAKPWLASDLCSLKKSLGELTWPVQVTQHCKQTPSLDGLEPQKNPETGGRGNPTACLMFEMFEISSLAYFSRWYDIKQMIAPNVVQQASASRRYCHLKTFQHVPKGPGRRADPSAFRKAFWPRDVWQVFGSPIPQPPAPSLISAWPYPR